MYLFVIIALTAVLILIFVYYYSFRYEITNFKLSRVNISVSLKPEDNKDTENKKKLLFSVLHLSDFHLRKDKKGEKLSQFVKNLKDIRADFIFITGDLVEKNEDIDYLIDMLSCLKAKYKKHVVFGVHDYYNKLPIEFIKNMFRRKRVYRRENDVRFLISKLKDIGFKVLLNNKEIFRLYNTDKKSCASTFIKEIDIIGLDDPIIEKVNVEKAFGDIKSGQKISFKYSNDKVLLKEKYKNTFKLKKDKIHTLNHKHKLQIALIHTPDRNIISELSERGVDIILSGHTHGGQVRLPFIGALLSGCNIKTKFASGLFYFRNFVLYVSRGLGEGRFSPFRFYCQPEATFIKIYYYDGLN